MRLASILIAACAACGSTSSAPGGPGADAAPGANGGVFPSDTTSVQIAMTGGLAPAAGSGSTCQPADDHFTYELATRHLSWTICSSPTVGGVYTPVPGAKTLSDADAAQLVAALRALQPATMACGGDFTETFVFVTPAGSTSYSAICMPGASDVMDLVESAAAS